ncbi:MAG: hypothetical protein AAF224_07140 [Pseudomonadota bacterium]
MRHNGNANGVAAIQKQYDYGDLLVVLSRCPDLDRLIEAIIIAPEGLPMTGDEQSEAEWTSFVTLVKNIRGMRDAH